MSSKVLSEKIVTMEHSHDFDKFYFENEIDHLGIFTPLNSEAEKGVLDMAIDHDYHENWMGAPQWVQEETCAYVSGGIHLSIFEYFHI